MPCRAVLCHAVLCCAVLYCLRGRLVAALQLCVSRLQPYAPRAATLCTLCTWAAPLRVQVSYENASSSGSMFSKAAFIADGNEVDMDDPEFWTKILPEMQAKNPDLADYYIKRKSKQVKRFGMVELDDEDELDEAQRKKFKKEEDHARRAARKALAHVWSKTERMNCERALLSFGFGRWGRIKDSAQGGTKLRQEEEIANFATAFVCLCVGVPVGTVGHVGGPNAAVVGGIVGGSSGGGGGSGGAAAGAGAGAGASGGADGAGAALQCTPGGEVELEGITKARELLAQMGSSLPQLSKAQTEELEPLVTAGGAEYAERVHKLGAGFMARLLSLKRSTRS
jgi:hypothetical protein